MIRLRFTPYTTTTLEDSITKWYKNHEIILPEDLCIHRIELKSHISLLSKPTYARYMKVGNFQEIIVDSRIPIIYQREQFFHELCHALRHTGRQSIMPKAFYELQERDARHFTLYASLPYHMIKEYTLTDPEIIDLWSQDFNIPLDICQERLEKIKRRPIVPVKNHFIT
ncbi:ImmA/IrrE family metallo-endopeptidase [Halobacillus kuroshimensis]|uniref:ImmA/IrrE family metallo-endopeptidase n=1 Tax=Halobacillus kuroshimensis TaxID=302481 RepID=UPI003140B024